MSALISNMSSFHSFVMSWITYLDSFGASTWNLRVVAGVSAVVLLSMRYTIGHKWNVDWDALVHAVISGVGSAVCIYLNIYAASHMTGGVNEPLGTIQCNGALTSLHRIIPAITQGYAICDIINGWKLGPAFLAHGIGTFTIMTLFNELEASAIITPMLIMEVSTIVLAMLRCEFFTPKLQLITQATFALLFFVCRILIAPYLCLDVIVKMNEHLGDCYPRFIYYVTLVFGVFFNGLNLFWFIKLVKKIQRKIRGEEAIGHTQVSEYDDRGSKKKN